MDDLKKFVDNVEKGILSDRAPLEYMDDRRLLNDDPMDTVAAFKAREKCNKRGMWAVVDKQWTGQLANWINGRKCLEVMAGAGWLAKALRFHGVDIIATDDYSWKDKKHKGMSIVSPVEELSGIEAVKQYSDREVLIVSWPPYDKEEICYICDNWGTDKPIVYIGEGSGGCCATDYFWEMFWQNENGFNINIPKWWGIHDYLCVGYWSKVSKGKAENSIGQLEVREEA